MLVDMTMKFSQNVGYVDTNQATVGSITIPAAPKGKTNFYAIVALGDSQRENGKRPGVTLDQATNVLSWRYSYNQNFWGYFSLNCRIYYGYF